MQAKNRELAEAQQQLREKVNKTQYAVDFYSSSWLQEEQLKSSPTTADKGRGDYQERETES